MLQKAIFSLSFCLYDLMLLLQSLTLGSITLYQERLDLKTTQTIKHSELQKLCKGKYANMTSNDCRYVLTVGGHEEAGVDLLGVAEVWLDLLPAGIKLPLMDAAGFDVQHVVTDLPITAEKSNINKEPFVFCLCFCFVCPRLLTLKRIREIF